VKQGSKTGLSLGWVFGAFFGGLSQETLLFFDIYRSVSVLTYYLHQKTITSCDKSQLGYSKKNYEQTLMEFGVRG